MLWVGGSIVVHGLEALGWHAIGHFIHDAAAAVAHALPAAGGALEWTVKAALDGLFGLAVGFALIPIAAYVITPLGSFLSTMAGRSS
jgi:predicted DNA repair protein MutK